MKQIKTIRRADPEDFDKDVNNALLEGWALDKRYISDVGFVAELEREIITEAERCCENCAHYALDPSAEPCLSCEDVNDSPNQWEPAER